MSERRHLRAVPEEPKRDPKDPLRDSVAEAALSDLCYELVNLRAALAIVEQGDFFHDEPGWIFAAQVALMRRGCAIDPAAVRSEIGEDRWKACETFLTLVDAQANASEGGVETFAERIREFARRRETVQIAEQVIYQARSTPVRVRGTQDLDDALEKPLAELRTALARRRNDATPMASGQAAPETRGTPTGFTVLDNAGRAGKPRFTGWTDGYHVAAARSGHGKTALALCCAVNVAAKFGYAHFDSLEMPEDKLRMRVELIIGEAMRAGAMNEEQAANVRKRLLFTYHKGATTPRRVLDGLLRTRDSVAKVGGELKLALIDYVQARRWLGEDQMRGIGKATEELETIEAEGVPTLVLAQLNRDADVEEGPPDRSMIYGGSYVIIPAQSVLFLHRPKKYVEDAFGRCEVDVIVDKQRAGANGFTVHCWWQINRYWIWA